MGCLGWPKELTKHHRITRIDQLGVQGVFDQGEKCGKKGVLTSFGCLLGASSELGQEREDLIRGDGFEVPVREGGGELG